MTTAEKIENALAVLGSTPEEVAERLGAEGCFGYPQSGAACPVADYLIAKRGLSIANVDADCVTLWIGNFGSRDVAVPAPVESFIHRFDAGDFEQLAIQEDGE